MTEKPIDLAILSGPLDTALKEGLRAGRWELYRIAPAIWHAGPLSDDTHAHLVNGDRIGVKGYERPEPGRCDMAATCLDSVRKITKLQQRGRWFFWLN